MPYEVSLRLGAGAGARVGAGLIGGGGGGALREPDCPQPLAGGVEEADRVGEETDRVGGVPLACVG